MSDEEDTHPVTLPSGAVFKVYEQEVGWIRDRAKRYLSTNSFVNISDEQDLDRVLIAELLCFRWGHWLSEEHDYFGEAIDDKAVADRLNKTSHEVRMTKQSMGLDKATRDRQKGEESWENYQVALLSRARAFGYMRNEQASKAIELFQELKGRITFYNNTTEDERIELRTRFEDVMRWIQEEAIPEFDEIDAQFRKTEQQYWVTKQ